MSQWQKQQEQQEQQEQQHHNKQVQTPPTQTLFFHMF